jgi:hypothetical protein
MKYMNITVEVLTAHKVLESISHKVISKTDERFSKTFKIKNLPNHEEFNNDANTHEDSKHLFTELDQIECDSLYWFTLDTNEQAKELNNHLNTYRDKNKKGSKGYRCIPATNKNKNSNVLYVGIRGGGISK